MRDYLRLIDAHDTREHEFAGAIHGVDLQAEGTDRPPKSGHGAHVVTGLQSFYVPWWNEEQAKLEEEANRGA